MIELKAVRQVSVQPWMVSREVSAVLGALGMGFFVGGCVRNFLLGQAVDDIDIATPLVPDAVMAALQRAGIKAIPTGIEHGTVTAVTGDQHFEITSLRRDVETDGRRAVVAFTTDWLEDARRRDFTMNTLLADPEGRIYDPTGVGISDLEAGTVRFVGEAEERIREDYLRILRYFRFHACYGRGDPDRAALAACNKYADKVKLLSRERVTQEFFKILSFDNPVDILSLMFKNSVLKELSYPHYKEDSLRHLCTFQNSYELRFVASRLYALTGFDLSALPSIDKILLVPKVFKRDIDAISQVLLMADLSADKTVRAAVYKYGRVATAQALMIELAQDRVMNGYAPQALRIVQQWQIPDFPLSGEDLKKAGVKAGPQMGASLRRVEDWWIEQDFGPDKKACLGQL